MTSPSYLKKNQQSVDLENQIKEAIQKAVAFSLYQFANEVLIEITDLAEKGLRFDGTPQRPNKPSTLKTKAAKGQGSTPLLATKELNNPMNYTIKQITGNFDIQIVPSERNKQVLQYLEEMADPYLYIGMPKTINGIPIDKRFEQIIEQNTRGIRI